MSGIDSPSGSGRRSLAHAQELLELGRYRQAEDSAREFLSGEPADAEGLRVLARALGEQHRVPEALHAVRSALRSAPDSISVLTTYADLLSDDGQFEEAQEVAAQAVEIAPHHWATHYSFARVVAFAPKPQLRLAYQAALRSRELAPFNADAHNLCGLIANELNLTGQASAHYAEALRLDPHHALALNNRAVMSNGPFGLFDAARGLRAAVWHDPQSELIRTNLSATVTRFLVWSWIAVGLSGFVAYLTLLSDGEWWLRASIGALTLGTVVTVGWRFSAQLPAGFALNRLATWREVSKTSRGVLVVLSLVLGLVAIVCFAPSQWALIVGGGLVALLRALLLCAALRGIIGAIGSARRQR